MTTITIRRRLSSERGASMVEYGLLVVLIAVAALVAVQFFGGEVSSTYSTITDSVAAAST